MSWFSGLFSGGGSSGGFDWTGAVLSGISAYSASRSSSNASRQNSQDISKQGTEGRKTIAFERALDDYYSQKNKLRKREALDTYSAFSKLSSYAPQGYALPAKPVVPSMPSA